METKEKIIQKAGELFMKYGVRRVTMDEIAKELVVSKKTLYQYFKDKDEIVSVATNFMIEMDKNEFIGIKEESSNSIEELFLVSKCIREKIGEMNPSLLFDLQKFHPEAWGFYVNYKEIMLDYIADSIRQGIAEGYFRTNLDPDTIARMRLEMVQMVFDDSIFPKNRFDFKEVQLQLFDFFVEGIITDKGRDLMYEYLEKNKELTKTNP